MKKFNIRLSLRDGTPVAGWEGEAINIPDAVIKAREAHPGHPKLVAEVVDRPGSGAGDAE